MARLILFTAFFLINLKFTCFSDILSNPFEKRYFVSNPFEESYDEYPEFVEQAPYESNFRRKINLPDELQDDADGYSGKDYDVEDPAEDINVPTPFTKTERGEQLGDSVDNLPDEKMNADSGNGTGK